MQPVLLLPSVNLTGHISTLPPS